MTPSVTVSDAGPIHYLTLIDALHVLPQLFGRILLPEKVREELLHPNAPEAVRSRMTNLDPWFDLIPNPGGANIPGLHPGEAAVIATAGRFKPARILMDDQAGRRVAALQKFEVFGTVGILELAAEQNLVDLTEAILSLRATNFHISRAVLNLALERNHSRK